MSHDLAWKDYMESRKMMLDDIKSHFQQSQSTKKHKKQSSKICIERKWRNHFSLFDEDVLHPESE